jgi:hypothetical protein
VLHNSVLTHEFFAVSLQHAHYPWRFRSNTKWTSHISGSCKQYGMFSSYVTAGFFAPEDLSLFFYISFLAAISHGFLSCLYIH